MLKKSLVLVGTGLSALAMAPSAQAALLGDTVTADLSSNGFSILNTTEVVLDPGIEFSRPIGNGALSLDLKSDSFDIIYNLGSFPSVGGPTTWTLSDLDWINGPGIVTGVTLTSGDASAISGTSFTSDSITVNLFDVVSPPQPIVTWSFDIETEHVPEPITILGSLAALGFGGAMKRKLDRSKS